MLLSDERTHSERGRFRFDARHQRRNHPSAPRWNTHQYDPHGECRSIRRRGGTRASEFGARRRMPPRARRRPRRGSSRPSGNFSGPNGNLPATLPKFVARVSDRIDTVAEEIERELRAQIEKVRAAGIEPSHLDTHKHTHAHPFVMEVLARVAPRNAESRAFGTLSKRCAMPGTRVERAYGNFASNYGRGGGARIAPQFLTISRIRFARRIIF